MGEDPRDFYDALAASYHLMFPDWEASMARQSAALCPILERECGPADAVRILDCACGIGTQALGLAQRGFQVTGTDLSPRAIERARQEAAARGLEMTFHPADMRNLNEIPETRFDAVVCLDNSLPHLLQDDQLAAATNQIRAKLRPGGTFLASIRDYDHLIEERPLIQGPAFLSDGGRQRIVFQIWDWLDDRRYAFHLYITRETDEGWHTHHGVAVYRALQRAELTRILEAAGFGNIRWLQPADSGYYQPIVLAVA